MLRLLTALFCKQCIAICTYNFIPSDMRGDMILHHTMNDLLNIPLKSPWLEWVVKRPFELVLYFARFSLSYLYMRSYVSRVPSPWTLHNSAGMVDGPLDGCFHVTISPFPSSKTSRLCCRSPLLHRDSKMSYFVWSQVGNGRGGQRRFHHCVFFVNVLPSSNWPFCSININGLYPRSVHHPFSCLF